MAVGLVAQEKGWPQPSITCRMPEKQFSGQVLIFRVLASTVNAVIIKSMTHKDHLPEAGITTGRPNLSGGGQTCPHARSIRAAPGAQLNH